MPELLNIGLMEQKVQLKSPKTKEEPLQGASERGQCQIQPYERKGPFGSLSQGVSTKVHALKTCLQKSQGHREPPCNRVTAGSTLVLMPETCPLKKACDLLGECLVYSC